MYQSGPCRLANKKIPLCQYEVNTGFNGIITDDAAVTTCGGLARRQGIKSQT